MQNKMKGVTLIEILLVLAIIGIIIVAGFGYLQQRATQMRIDRTTTQMHQILNAGLSYYVANGKWPVKTGETPVATASGLSTYLPQALRSPWNSDYVVTTDDKLFYVFTSISSSIAGKSVSALSNVIAGTLPLSYTATAFGAPPAQADCLPDAPICYIVASVNIPGQNLNNATAVNFGGLYRNGSCIPVPSCPVDNAGKKMSAQVLLTPVQVSGTYGDTTTNPTSPQVFPISGFNTIATGGNNNNPPACDPNQTPTPCDPATGAGNGFWRACMQVVTEKGELTDTNSNKWSDYQTMMAVTRCAINNEPSGTPFQVQAAP